MIFANSDAKQPRAEPDRPQSGKARGRGAFQRAGSGAAGLIFILVTGALTASEMGWILSAPERRLSAGVRRAAVFRPNPESG